MASIPIFLIILCVFLLPINVKAQTERSNNISLGSSLSPNINSNSTTSWSSPSGFFSFGFYPRGNGFAVGIWIVNQTGRRTIVWTANPDDPPVSSNATLELTSKRGLLLRTEQSKDRVITNISDIASSAAMLDCGDFQLLNEFGNVIWQTFDHPTDTILGGQVLRFYNELVSSKSRPDHSIVRFFLGMNNAGNLVSYHYVSILPYSINYWSTTSSGGYSRLHLNRTGSLFLQGTCTCSTVHVLSNGSYHDENKTIIYRATLDDDGIFRLYSHHMVGNSTSSSSRVKVIWSSLKSKCQVLRLCGLNSFCKEVAGEAECFCFPGFDFINPSMKFLGCYQNFTVDSCRGDDDGVDDQGRQMVYNISTMKNTWWDDTVYAVLEVTEEACIQSCLADCNCWAVTYSKDFSTCRKSNFPFSDGRTYDDIPETAHFKVVFHKIGDPEEPNHSHLPLFPAVLIQSKNNSTVLLILALSLGSVACLCFVFAVSSFIVYKNRYHRYKKLLENANLGLGEDLSLQSFSYDELERATNGFKEEIGRGTFGAVYKGILSESDKLIAVKRLEKVVEEGIREFQAEMTTIGRTHHRNLVQLLGFCVEGSRKLLVYEFMSNGSLADRLFKTVSPPVWRERVRFVFDVARGIFYLHDGCGVHIIHCNLKPQNILLDDTWTAKISDFGLARLLIMPNQAKTSAEVEGTTIGYLAPEWKKNALISVKSDIYSFGIVLLEIICRRRNIKVDVANPDEITLSHWVYKCFKDGELDKLVQDEEVDFPTLERMIKVGLWCIQDDPALRPLMKDVILMLEGTMNIPVPPSPDLVILP